MKTHSWQNLSFLQRAIIWILVLGGTGVLVRAADPNEFQVYSHFSGTSTTSDLPGRLFVPLNYNPSQSYPLVVFFHGQGEMGNNNTSQVNGNIDNLLANAKTRNFFLYAPQLSSSAGTWNVTYVDNAMRMAAHAAVLYNIDRSKIYLTGLSLGGGAVWYGLTRYTDGLAGAVISCGSPPDGSPSYAPLVGKPIWAFHARNDTTVYPANTRDRINWIRAADGGKPALVFPLNDSPSNPYYNTGAPYYTDGSTYYSENNLRYSEYASGGHGIWGRVYNEDPMYTWLLGQSNSLTTATLQVGELMLFDFGLNPVPGPDNQGRKWNSTSWGLHNSLGTVFPFAMTSEGGATSVSLDLQAAFSFHVGNPAGSPSTIYPSNIGDDGWITTMSGEGRFLIHGLIPGASYQLKLFASNANDDDGGHGRMSRYQVGTQYVDLQVYNNFSNTAVLSSVAADSTGSIQLRVLPAPGTTSRYGQINTLELTRLAPSDTTAPAVTITAPTSATTYATASATINLAGTASDNVAVTQVTWVNDRGGGGTATGTTSWSVNNVALQNGANVITVTARDAANNTSTDVLTVTSSAGGSTPQVLPVTGGVASGSAYFPLQYGFDAQPVSPPTVGLTGSGGTFGSNPNGYAGRQGYIDFGPNFAKLTIKEIWTAYWAWTNYNGTLPFGSLWWSSTTDNVYNAGSDILENRFNFATQAATVGAQALWTRDASGLSITPPARYLIVAAPASGTFGSDRVTELAFVGFINP